MGDGSDVADVTREPSPVEAAIATETADVIAAAVAQLPDTQRMVAALRIWNELSYAEIAQIAQRSESTVRSNMFHALAALRKCLERRLNPSGEP
jgi:RNA polymerase sigma-70 factor, ECF subfamily